MIQTTRRVVERLMRKTRKTKDVTLDIVQHLDTNPVISFFFLFDEFSCYTWFYPAHLPPLQSPVVVFVLRLGMGVRVCGGIYLFFSLCSCTPIFYQTIKINAREDSLRFQYV